MKKIKEREEKSKRRGEGVLFEDLLILFCESLLEMLRSNRIPIRDFMDMQLTFDLLIASVNTNISY